jgi:hypothetical protein
MRNATIASLAAASTALLALAAATPAPALARAEGDGDTWTQRLMLDLSPSDLGLRSGASARTLARAALERNAGRLGLPGSLRGLRVARAVHAPGGAQGAGELELLRFQQTVSGVRVVWSQIDVAIAAGDVSSISATVVPVAGTRLPGERRISRGQALRIARRAVKGPETALEPQPVAYAGRPSSGGKRWRSPRLAWVVESAPARERERERDDESTTGLCVVVDAETGTVLERWKGSAARPEATRRRAAKPAQASNRAVVVDVFADNGNRYYARYIVEGDPHVGANWPSLARARANASFGGVPDNPLLDRLAENAKNAAFTICAVRNYCGQNGGFNGPIAPWRVHRSAGASSSRANRQTLGILIADRDVQPLTEFNDVMAHEFGHVMDWVYAGDRLVSFAGFEVEEGLADMFAYDYDRGDATIGEPPPLLRNLQTPWLLAYSGQPMPDHMSGYDCSPPGVQPGDPANPHFNSTILSHGYYLFVQSVGHPVAGNVLQYIPFFLDPNPRFVDVKSGFNTRAAQLYPNSPQVARASKDAFVNGVGIGVFDPPGC